MKPNASTILAAALVFFIASRVAINAAAAQSTYTIPLLGGKWNTQTIPVYVPTTPKADYNLTVQALWIWNQSMTWFTNTYYPNTPLYSFTMSDQHSPVQVEFYVGEEIPTLPAGRVGLAVTYLKRLVMVQYIVI